MITHLRASLMFGDTICYNAQRHVTLNLKQRSGLNLHTRYYASSTYLQVFKRSELNWLRKPRETIFSDHQGQLTP